MIGAGRLFTIFSFPLTLVYWIIYILNGSSGSADIDVPRYLESPNIGALIIVSVAVVSMAFAELWDKIPYPFFLFAVSMMGLDVLGKLAIYAVDQAKIV